MDNTHSSTSASGVARSLQTLATQPTERPAARQRPGEDVFANQRQRVESTQATLSGLGRLRSAESQLQNAAREVAKTENAKPADVEATVKRFAENYNRTRRAASDDSLAREARADQAARGIEGAVRSTGSERLQKIGINVEKDGSLRVDSQKLQEALQNSPDNVSKALKELATRTDTATRRDVGQDGNGGQLAGRTNAVSAESARQEQQRSDALAQVQELQKRYEQPLNNATGNALANYTKTQLV